MRVGYSATPVHRSCFVHHRCHTGVTTFQRQEHAMTTVGASPLLRSGLFRYRVRAAGTAVAITALTVAGLGAVAPASSAPDQSCPTAFPVGQLARGQAVHGLTVSQGTTPESFTGQVIGVIDDGIAL